MILPAVDGLAVAYKRTFIDVSPALSASLPRSNSMPSLRLDESDDTDDDAVYIEDLDLDYKENIRPLYLSPALALPDQTVPTPLAEKIDTPSFPQNTTVMLRNIPNRLSQAEIVDALNTRGFRGMFDFFYAPLDFKSKAGLGYAFVNFTSAERAELFRSSMDGQRLVIDPHVWSQKVCGVSWARIQGLDANVKHYRNNPVNELSDEFRPCLFSEKGVKLDFPAPEVATLSYAPIRVSRLEKKRTPTQGNKLFIGGLNMQTTGKDLEHHFSKFGQVVEAVVLTDKLKGGQSKGYGFCTFADEAAVRAAMGAQVHWVDGVSVAVRPYTSTTRE